MACRRNYEGDAAKSNISVRESRPWQVRCRDRIPVELRQGVPILSVEVLHLNARHLYERLLSPRPL
jgi:hypothetical protein